MTEILDRPATGLTGVPLALSTSTKKDFTSDQEVRWCPGCGDYLILAAVQSFLPTLGVAKENIVCISGIGCSSRFPHYLDTYGIHSIHGRAPTIATGLATSRPDLSVWVVTGDGDALSIGGNHLIHALRRNVNLTILLFNNRIYGLTKGQYSPTSERGKVTKSTPRGSLEAPFNPISLALGAEATFVARTIDSERAHLTSTLEAAARHRGAALVEIYQNCPIFNDGAFDGLKQDQDGLVRLVDGEPVRSGRVGFRRDPDTGELVECDPDDPRVIIHRASTADPSQAFALSRLADPQTHDRTPIGIFRQVSRPSYGDQMAAQIDAAIGADGPAGPADLHRLLSGSDTWTVRNTP